MPASDAPTATAAAPTDDELLAALKAGFGYDEFRPGQLEIIRSVLGGRDTMAVMPTGGGKSLCYQVPALVRPGIVVVISPLISLMQDQVQALKEREIPAGCIHSAQTVDEKRAVFREMNGAERFLLYISPERVQKGGFHRWLEQNEVSLIAIDEAHCISQWGHDFRPDYTRLDVFRRLRPDVPVLALTATATPAVLEDIGAQLELADPGRYVYGFYRPNLYYQVEFCTNEAEKKAYLEQALHQFPRGRAIIYCGTRRLCEELSAELGRNFGGVGYYHAGMDNALREAVQQRYEAGEVRVLCATNAFGMGIDHPDVRLVAHWQIPGSVEALYQEMGRAGRDREDATCLVLYARKDRGLHAHFIRKAADAPADVRRARWAALEAVTAYAEGGACRHGEVLTYFRDAHRIEECGHCDACDPQSPRRVVVPEAVLEQVGGGAGRRRRRKGRTAGIETLTPEQQARAHALKAWRKDFAAAKEMPAFMVFSNKTLRALAAHNPATMVELAEIHGIGPQKLEALGPELLGVLGDAAAGDAEGGQSV